MVPALTLPVVDVDEVSWIRVEWDGGPDDPVVLLSAFNAGRLETRKVEEFRDGRVGLAEEFARSISTRLGSAVVPEVDEINADPQFRAEELSSSQFEAAWAAAVREVTRGDERFRCRCCGVRSLAEPALGSYEICRHCDWEDDPVQSNDETYKGGANAASLSQQREHHLKTIDPKCHQRSAVADGSLPSGFLVGDQAVGLSAAVEWLTTGLAAGYSVAYDRTEHEGAPIVQLVRSDD